MELEGNQIFSKKMDEEAQHQQWLTIDDNVSVQSRFAESSSSMEDSTTSKTSCSSSELAEDATSSCSSLLLGDHANGPLYELSDLVAQLPIKRGLSKFYEGKSESHTSLASVKSLEDLAKTGNHRNTKKKWRKRYGWGLDVQNSCISKNKASRGSVLSSLAKKTRSFVVVSSTDTLPSPINICLQKATMRILG